MYFIKINIAKTFLLEQSFKCHYYFSIILCSGPVLADRLERRLICWQTAEGADAGAGAVRDDDLGLHLDPEGVRPRQRLHPQPDRSGVPVSECARRSFSSRIEWEEEDAFSRTFSTKLLYLI